MLCGWFRAVYAGAVTAALPGSRGSPGEVAATFLKLGLTSFGGPIAHLGYFRAECVEKRRWLADDEYADLVALCQFLPGPASSQLVFALGMRRAGIVGALIASACFLLPSALLMIAFAYGVASVGDLRGALWIHGLKVAAVAVVAQAVWTMGVKLCPDVPRVAIAVAGAVATVVFPGSLAQIGVIALGALVASVIFRNEPAPPRPEAVERARGHVFAVGALVLFASLLVVPRFVHLRAVEMFDAFYRPGALVFGGGHVVLPLLREALVPAGWLSDDAFLAGYGAAQAVPGPMFSFAAYLGTIIDGGWAGGLWALFAIFLPCWLLIGGALPFWHQLRARRWMQAAMRGANAAVVGVLLGALYSPVITQAIHGVRDAIMATVALALLSWKAPAWAVVILAAVAAQLVGSS